MAGKLNRITYFSPVFVVFHALFLAVLVFLYISRWFTIQQFIFSIFIRWWVHIFFFCFCFCFYFIRSTILILIHWNFKRSLCCRNGRASFRIVRLASEMYTLCVCVHWPVDLKWFFFSRSLRGAVHFINPQYISVQFHFILDIRYIHWYIYSFNFFFLLRVTKMFSLIFSIWFLSRYSQFRFFIQAFHRAFNHFTNFPHLNLFDNSIFFFATSLEWHL